MAEKANEKKRNVLSSFVVLLIVLSVLAVSVTPVIAPPVPPEITNIIVTADPTSIPADDESVSDITASTEWSDGILSLPIHFEITSQPGGASLTDEWDQVDTGGNAYTQLIAGPNSGEVEIKASAQGEGWYVENFTTVTLLPPPTLTPWNNITKDDSTEVTINESECVYFNATADQPIDTWR
ncbi:MAG: hypothetical protein JJE19_07740, partial [Methanosarcinales archaeon]|nr:hypothetical protein [Methanosarcinales archaeon]